MENKARLTPGIILIVLGIIFFLINLDILSMRTLWPGFVLIIGLGFLCSYFASRRNYGLLMPGSILTIIGLLFFYCAFCGWDAMAYLWPIFLIAPAVGLFLMYVFGRRETGLLIPSGILAVLGIIFLSLSPETGVFWPVLLIIMGLIIVILGQRGQ